MLGLTFLTVPMVSNFTYVLFAAKPNSQGLLPDLQTVVPQQLQLVNSQQRELLRLSNGVANTGLGPWQMRPEILQDSSQQKAIQQILDANGNVVREYDGGSIFAYHPAHKHFHISGVAKFEVHSGSPTGKLVGEGSEKVTSCLIDWIQMEGNSPNNQRGYTDCDADVQGITPGWVDQYHMALEGQSIDITGAPPGKYYLVSTANPEGFFLEENTKNDAAWVSFELLRDGSGNAKIEITGHSPCTGSLCGEDFPNR
jgi:lysyl oxidase